MNIRPLHDRVDSATEKPVRGEILSVGKGKVAENGDVRPLDVKVGDTVLFGKYSGTEIKIEGEDVLVMREDDIMGVFASKTLAGSLTRPL